jgi:CubicO group peptidase (beta-lactamase class C family)
MIRVLLAFVFVTLSGCAHAPRAESSGSVAVQRVYFPPAGSWEHRRPSQVGMDDAKIDAAVAWALTQETDWPKDFSKQKEIFGNPLGPMPSTRAGTNGVIIRHGYIVAEFGTEPAQTRAVDPTYSCAKSYLSTILGLTIDRGMIPRVTDPVGNLIHDGGYDSEHNAKVTWQHHVTQSSEWAGDLFGKSHTFQGAEEYGKSAMASPPRALMEPGTYYEYNDVRVNRMSLSLLRLWKRPLPDVLKTEIMDPIGASGTWVYHGYRTSIVDVEGTPMASVSGGTRWGGGLWINTLDHARFGLLMLRKGAWNGRRIISESWIADATRPQGVKADYGYMWWLNTEGRWPAAPRSSYSAQGAGDNTIWIDPEHDLVVVWRWHKGSAQPEFYKRIIEAIEPPAHTGK